MGRPERFMKIDASPEELASIFANAEPPDPFGESTTKKMGPVQKNDAVEMTEEVCKVKCLLIP